MEILVGIILALAVSLMAHSVGLDRERGFYAVIVIISASYYDLFAVMGGTMGAAISEMLPFMIFLAVALWGFKQNLWLVAAALAGHGIFDFYHARLITNGGTPAWWAMFCLSFDFTSALYFAWRLSTRNSWKWPKGLGSTALPQDSVALSFF